MTGWVRVLREKLMASVLKAGRADGLGGLGTGLSEFKELVKWEGQSERTSGCEICDPEEDV